MCDEILLSRAHQHFDAFIRHVMCVIILSTHGMSDYPGPVSPSGHKRRRRLEAWQRSMPRDLVGGGRERRPWSWLLIQLLEMACKSDWSTVIAGSREHRCLFQYTPWLAQAAILLVCSLVWVFHSCMATRSSPKNIQMDSAKPAGDGFSRSEKISQDQSPAVSHDHEIVIDIEVMDSRNSNQSIERNLAWLVIASTVDPNSVFVLQSSSS